MMRRSLILAAGLTCLLCSACTSLRQAAEPKTTFAQQGVYADQAVRIIHMAAAPGDGTIVIKCKEGDPDARAIERAVQARLRAAGYAVQLALPPDERQKGDPGRYGTPGASIDLIPYEGSNYAELAVTLHGERFSRLFSTAGSSPAPVSNWVKREREGGGE